MKNRSITRLSLVLLYFLMMMSLFGQSLCQENFVDIDCGESITASNATSTNMSLVDRYCGVSTNLTGPEKVYRITPTNTANYTFLMKCIAIGSRFGYVSPFCQL